jgi:hypothetical protein
MIKTLQIEYIQKSRIFLYPLLDIKKGSDAVPIESYIAWQDKFKPEDHKFMCTYHLRDDDAFKRFERFKLLGSKLFDSFYETSDELGVYVFDFSTFGSDWENFLAGKYSKLSSSTKTAILKFFMANKSNYHYINSYLNPDQYFDIYAQLLGVEERMLKSVGELCSKPDMSKELLVAQEKTIGVFNF